jgi:hypothetical protein
LAEGEELLSNPLSVRFQYLRITYHLVGYREYGFSKVLQAGRCPACKTLLEPDLEQGDNTNIVVRRDPTTGEVIRVLVHR